MSRIHTLCYRFYVDPEGARKVPYTLHKFLYSFSCANNCLNPLFYNFFSMYK